MNLRIAKLFTAIFVLSIFLFSTNDVQAAGVLLKQGAQGEQVKQVQQKLKDLGYFNENITGYYGTVTKKAVENYQRDNKFSIDGIVGPATWSALVGGNINSTNQITVSRSNVSRLSKILKQGMSGDEVKLLQTRLKELGHFNEKVTGYYGTVTKKAVENYQSANGCKADGIVGNVTWSKLFGDSTVARTEIQVSRGSVQNGEALVSWSQAQNIFKIGCIATVIDIGTGIKFNIKRTMGYNHADCETLTSEDTAKMKKAFGGQWTWNRRPIILVVDGRQLAASMSGMPHAGLEDKPALQYVSGRSGGYGGGQNLDTIKGNNMSGHFDVHFLNSRTHGTNKVDGQHQAAIKEAARYIESH